MINLHTRRWKGISRFGEHLSGWITRLDRSWLFCQSGKKKYRFITYDLRNTRRKRVKNERARLSSWWSSWRRAVTTSWPSVRPRMFFLWMSHWRARSFTRDRFRLYQSRPEVRGRSPFLLLSAGTALDLYISEESRFNDPPEASRWQKGFQFDRTFEWIKSLSLSLSLSLFLSKGEDSFFPTENNDRMVLLCIFLSTVFHIERDGLCRG